jgi:signal peptidase II
MNRFPARTAGLRWHAAIFTVVLALDQLTKWWARARFSLPNGEPDYNAFIPVLGDWLHLRLVYNYNTAFGLQPQNLLPFLNPVVFFTLLTLAAIALFVLYYRRLGPEEKASRLGIALILSGAVGNNLIDRLTLYKVTDFIDVGIPGVSPRWPVFNIADSSVCIGIGLFLVSALFARAPANSGTSSTETPPHDA